MGGGQSDPCYISLEMSHGSPKKFNRDFPSPTRPPYAIRKESSVRMAMLMKEDVMKECERRVVTIKRTNEWFESSGMEHQIAGGAWVPVQPLHDRRTLAVYEAILRGLRESFSPTT